MMNLRLNPNELTGSPKQKAWANNVRYEMFTGLLMMKVPNAEAVIEKLLQIKDAKFWIDNRAQNLDFFVAKVS